MLVIIRYNKIATKGPPSQAKFFYFNPKKMLDNFF
jgi:hypothetical protein